jgi:hypothetical protein
VLSYVLPPLSGASESTVLKQMSEASKVCAATRLGPGTLRPGSQSLCMGPERPRHRLFPQRRGRRIRVRAPRQIPDVVMA